MVFFAKLVQLGKSKGSALVTLKPGTDYGDQLTSIYNIRVGKSGHFYVKQAQLADAAPHIIRQTINPTQWPAFLLVFIKMSSILRPVGPGLHE